ncbi:hypothetical protein QF000_006497 [Paraburkholderia atlantica]
MPRSPLASFPVSGANGGGGQQLKDVKNKSPLEAGFIDQYGRQASGLGFHWRLFIDEHVVCH